MVQPAASPKREARSAIYLRVTWTVLTYIAVQSLVLGTAILPVAWLVGAVDPYLPTARWQRWFVYAVGLLPTYVAFALSLALATAAATWALRWRPRANETMALHGFGWPLMDWARCCMMTHVECLLVGIPLRATPLWGFCLRLNGATLGHRVWVNSTNIIDHNLLSFGDDVVIGSGVHLSGHTVEHGVVKTGRVVLGRDVTIGVGSVVCVGAEVGDHAQIGALSFVPKEARLAGGRTYVGAPIRAVDTPPNALASLELAEDGFALR